MSHREVTVVLDHAPRDWTPAKRLVAIALAERINTRRQAWPSMADLCNRTGLSERSVQRYLRDLEAEGWIECHGQRPGAGGQPVSNLWTWLRYIVVGVTPMSPGGVTPMSPLARGGGVTPMSPEPSVVTTRENRHYAGGHR